MGIKQKVTKEEALLYHSSGRKGKIEVVPTKPTLTQKDLSLAYSPGVAHPCLEIEQNPDLAYEYTAKGNLVAVVSNGTAVLGLGDIGALAGKPVMEGKGVLFKRFADVDVFDIELNSKNPDDIIKACELLEPTFGGINLEDIKAPDCFYIEEELKKRLKIPVFHDDQHGTAIIATAALINALEVINKKIDQIKVVINGAGASAIATANLIIKAGVKKENLIMCDTKGVIYKGRVEGMNKYKEAFAIETDKRTLEEAMDGADVFIGLSVKGAVTKNMVKLMARDPLIMALANPDPEITPEEVHEVRGDAIMATGRSDYPNQVNNVLGFPFIFRGALDVRATQINEEMKLAAVNALANLARQEVPESVCRAYGVKKIEFGREYLIPKPFDPRALVTVAPAVAKAAIETGVARIIITDWDKYKDQLEARLSVAREFTRQIIQRARFTPKRIVFPEGEYEKIIKAASKVIEEGFGHPVLLGNRSHIEAIAEKHNINIEGIEIICPENSENLEKYVKQLFDMRQRKGVTEVEAHRLLTRITTYYGAFMVLNGEADCLVTGYSRDYGNSVKPLLEVMPYEKDYKTASGSYFMVFKDKLFLFADTTVNIDPSAEHLAQIALQSADTAEKFDIKPKIAMLNFTNFGSVKCDRVKTIQEAIKIVKAKRPDIVIDGDMQADTATYPPIAEEAFPFSAIKGDANILIFPDLESGNIAYKLLYRIGNGTAIGPILQGFKHSVHVLQRGSDVHEIVYLAAYAVVDAAIKQQN
jgi:malate dehydrogenase (oxaloacetate-decarboxylating)(NADP+)